MLTVKENGYAVLQSKLSRPVTKVWGSRGGDLGLDNSAYKRRKVFLNVPMDVRGLKTLFLCRILRAIVCKDFIDTIHQNVMPYVCPAQPYYQVCPLNCHLPM